MQKLVATSMASLIFAGSLVNPTIAGAQTRTATPIKHLVVIFQENISFDHYFGTYPHAVNPPHEPPFYAAPGTPAVNGFTDGLLFNNPNYLNTAVNADNSNANPFRLDRSEAATSDQDHDYLNEQQAFNAGMMDSFPKYTGTPGPPPAGQTTGGLVMGYYDGNTVTAFWNYAQHYAMSDNSYGTNFGPSTDGALNLISGQLNGVVDAMNASADVVSDGSGGLTLVSDADPVGDMCSTTTGALLSMSGQNVGDLLNSRGISWGFFEGGFDLSVKNANGTTGCMRSTTSTVTGTKKADYIPHHQPFQYYASTQNLKHTRPSSPSTVGIDGDPANHQYDMHDFYDAVSAGNFPTVSFLKAPGYQDGHAGYSDPLDEQTFVVNVVNFLQKQKDWESTAVVIAYDDSDGWYDHQMGPIVNQSASAQDALSGVGLCGASSAIVSLPGVTGAHAQGRCGYGPRLPLLVISPYAKHNYVDHGVTDQTSILRFIEDNWLDSQRITGSFDQLAGKLNPMFDFHRSPSNQPPGVGSHDGRAHQLNNPAATTTGSRSHRRAKGVSPRCPASFMFLSRGPHLITRRRFLGQAGALAAGLQINKLPPVSQTTLDPETLPRYVDSLPIPQIAQPQGTRPSPENRKVQLPYYRMAMRAIQSKIHRDLPATAMWGFAESSPGPTFDIRSHQGVLVEWVNELPQKHFLPIDHTLHGAEATLPAVRSVIHLHGGKTPPDSDGYPEHWCVPGKSIVCHYPNRQDAATLFYHDHTMGINRLNIYAGLQGMYLLRDEAEDGLQLPKGKYEVPLLIYDRFLLPDGQLQYPVSPKAESPWVPEVFGNAILVNGKLFPYLEVEPRKYRFRLMNGSNGRFYRFSLGKLLTFQQIGTEQGFLPAPVEARRILLAPAERADLVFDFSAHAGQKLLLNSDSFELMEFRVAAQTAGDSPALPPHLRTMEKIPESRAVRTRRLTLDENLDKVQDSMGMLLNNTPWHMPVTEKPVLDTTEIWELVNLTEDAHPIHLHLVRFQILDRQAIDTFQFMDKGTVHYNGPVLQPAPIESGWKDTVRAEPGTITRIIVPFEGYAGRYVWHCHILEHEDNEMMRPYEVVLHPEPNQPPTHQHS